MKRGGGEGKGKPNSSKSNQKQLLIPQFPSKGSAVEVTSDEEGFKGVWYPATVLRIPSSSSNYSHSRNKTRAFIEYHTLLSDDNSSHPLREYVTVDHIRPPPPPSAANFRLGDAVDAYCKDGWWTGTITATVPHILSFVVTFPNPPDDRLFHQSALRLHRQWVDGKWLQPAQQRTAALMFSTGKKVEVSFDRLCNCWFPATVLDDTGNGCYLVEYETLKGSRTDHVKATVDSTHIRPCPPDLTDAFFSLRQKVDASYDNAWWRGTVIQELSNRNYVVHIKFSNKEKRLNYTDLRPHMDWTDGTWVRDDTKDTPKPSDEDKHSHTICRLNLNEADVESPRGFTLIRDKTPATVSTLTPSSLVNPTGTLADKIKIRGYASPAAVSNQSTGGDLSGGYVFGKRSKRKRKESHDDDSPVSGRTSGSLKIPVKSSINPVGGREKNGLGVSEEGAEKNGTAKQTSLPVIIGLECDKSSNSTAKKLSHSIGEGLVHVEVQDGLHIVPPKLKDDDDDETSTPETLKRGRGRPRKLETKISIASPSSGSTKDARVDKLLEKVISFDTDSLKDVEVKAAELDFTLPNKNFVINGSGSKLIVDQGKHENKFNDVALSQLRKPSEAGDQSLKQHMRSSKRGRKRTVNINLVSQIQDSPQPSSGKMVASNSTVNQVSEEKPTKAFEDQPLSQWFQEMLPTTNTASKTSPTINAAGASTINDGAMSNRQGAVVDHSKAVVIEGSQDWPFVRKSILWSTVESMEPLRKLPQKPHFRPLEQCEESCREGRAIGCMVNFCTVVDRTSKLQVDEPKSSISGLLETLLELEEHGFNVQVVRDRILGLLNMRQKQEKLRKQVEELNAEIQKQNDESAKIDEEMDELKQQMNVLQEKLTEAKSRKDGKNAEINSLRSKAEEVRRGIKGVERDFHSAAVNSVFSVVT